VNLQHRFNHKDQGGFSNASQRWAPIGRWVEINQNIEYGFVHGEVINYTLDGVSIHPVTTKIKIKSNFICTRSKWSYIQGIPDHCGAIYREYQITVELYTGSTRSLWSYIQGVPDHCGAIYREYQITVELYTGSISTRSM
jgi:hypothetical protein